MVKQYFGPDGMLTKYDKYRYVLAAAAATDLIKLSDGVFFTCISFFALVLCAVW